jgi:hypothetical protein
MTERTAFEGGRRRSVWLAIVLTLVGGGKVAGQLNVELAHDSEAERATRAALLRLVQKHDLSDWIYTTEIIVDESQIPHSHPVLTIDAADADDEEKLASTFIHEQFHWLEAGETLEAFEAAMADFERLYPDAPGREGGGARDVESTYRHLLVCDLELQAMTELFGEARARAVLAGITHYEWIYERVLNDPRVRDVTTRHGFALSGVLRR